MPVEAEELADEGDGVGQHKHQTKGGSQTVASEPKANRLLASESWASDQGIAIKRELLTDFQRLCTGRHSILSAEEIYDMRLQEVGAARPVTIALYKSALRRLNMEIRSKFGEEGIEPGSMSCMQAQTYLVLSNEQKLASLALSNLRRRALKDIMQIIINHSMMRDIASITHVDMASLRAPPTSRSERRLHVLDTLVGVLILLNVATLTLSLDIHVGWAGWETMEAVFTIVFALEIVARVLLVGFWKHFAGFDRTWNIFDACVIFLGVLDLIVKAAHAATQDSGYVTALRLLRFLRSVKTVRVLRVKMLKELRLILGGLLSGLRTIFWAFVFLFFFVLTMGTTTKQALSSPPASMPCDSLPWGCAASQQQLHAYRQELFGSVPRCMFTIFRCFVADGCSTLNGTPIMPFLWDQYGFAIILGYVLCYMFLAFGLSNLIMATIVENTMEASKVDDVKRKRHLQKERLRVALTVHELLWAMCSEDHEEDGRATTSPRRRGSGPSIGWSKDDHGELQTVLLARISRQQFLEKLDDPLVVGLLDRLGISTLDPSNYIDAFDADGDGLLSVAELVRGLLKLRGRVEKADVVAGLMVSRDLQKSLRVIEGRLARGHVGEMSLAVPPWERERASQQMEAPDKLGAMVAEASSCRSLSDAIDTPGDGMVSVDELVKGLLQLRGDARRKPEALQPGRSAPGRSERQGCTQEMGDRREDRTPEQGERERRDLSAGQAMLLE